jgi:hypothetical protein
MLATGGAVPAKLAALVKGVGKTMILSKVKPVLVCAMVMGICGSVGLLWQSTAPAAGAEAREKRDDPAAKEFEQVWGSDRLVAQQSGGVHQKDVKSEPAPKDNPEDKKPSRGFPGALPPDAPDAVPQAAMNLEQFKSKLKEQRGKIESLYVEYEITSKILVDDPKLALRWGLIAVENYKRIDHHAFKGSKRYQQMITPELAKPIGAPEVDPEAPKEVQEWQRKRAEEFKGDVNAVTPPMDQTWAYDGKTLWNRQKVGEQLKGAAADDVYNLFDIKVFWDRGGMTFQSEYLSNVGLHVPDLSLSPDTRQKRGFQFIALFPEDLDKAPYRVLEKTEKVEGAECLVVEAKGNEIGTWKARVKGEEVADKLWFDLEHGLALRKREFSSAGVLTERKINGKLKEVTPGVWLPQESRWQRMAPPWAKAYRDRPALEYVMTVRQFSVNDVKDSFFTVPKGAKIGVDER